MLPPARMALVAACTVVVILGMRIASAIVAPIMLGLVLTLAISPVLRWQVRKGMPTKLAYVTTLLATFLVGTFIALLLTASIASFAESLPDYKDEMQPYLEDVSRFFARLGVDLGELFTFKNVGPRSLVETGLRMANGVTNLLSGLVLVGLIMVFMLLETITFGQKVEGGMVGRALGAVDRLTTQLRSFVRVTAYLGAVVALLETIFLLVLGVPNALLWGTLSFFFSFIPYIGFVLALIPPALLALLTGGWVSAILVVAGYFAINTVSDELVKPRVIGSRTDLSPLAVFLSLVLWGWVLGPLGGLLAVPITLIVKGLLLEVYPEWKWLAVLLGNPPPKESKSTPPKERPAATTADQETALSS